jgi:hypothetical protein
MAGLSAVTKAVQSVLQRVHSLAARKADLKAEHLVSSMAVTSVVVLAVE